MKGQTSRWELREERKAQQEIERERARPDKERQHYLNALQALQASGDDSETASLEAELAEIERAIEHVDYRVANIRADYRYIISNIGSFGERSGEDRPGVTRFFFVRALSQTPRWPSAHFVQKWTK
jgi:hypothetical protein